MLKECVIAIFVTMASGLICGACYNSFDDLPLSEGVDVVANITTEELSQLLSADGYVDMDSDDDIRVKGYVTAHDESGNFYKSFYIESGGYGVEILEGLTNSYVRHELGAEIVVQLGGLRLARSYGVVQVGMAADAGSYYELDYMGHELIVDQYITNTGYSSVVEPRELTLAALGESTALATMLRGSLIRVVGLRYYVEEDEDDDDDALWYGTRCFIDSEDPLTDGEPAHKIWSYVSDYANFSLCEIESGSCSITGILQEYDIEGGEGLEMRIRPRALDDIEF